MTVSEFSNEFDVLYNNITSNQAPGLDEYEKSVFLTKAQDEIVKSYFDPRLNKPQEGFDGNEKRQIDFSMIMRTKSYTSFDTASFDNKPNTKKVTLDKDIMMFINEFADVIRGNNTNNKVRLTVIPLDYREYSRLMSKPYKRPLQYQAWRLLDNSDGINKAEIIIGPVDELKTYSIRYIKRPRPIIVAPLDGVTLDGYYGAYDDGSPCTDQASADFGLECELDPILHKEILQRAVELAKAAYTGDLNSQVALGSSSQTNIGAVPQSNNR